MRTSRFAVEQIAHALKRVEGGVVVGEVCRELGITETIVATGTNHLWAMDFMSDALADGRKLRVLTVWVPGCPAGDFRIFLPVTGCGSGLFRHA